MGESTRAVRTTYADWAARRKGGVAVTGASGWIGSALVDQLIALLPPEGSIALRLFGSAPRTLEIRGRQLAVESLADAVPLGDGEWLVLHLAVVGADRLGDAPDQLTAANLAVLDQALRLAETAAVRRFVHASSGAIHQTDASGRKRAYGDMKRAQENHVRAWAARTGAPLLMPRIFNVGGPYINHITSYALGDLISQALETGAVRIEARQAVVRSYVHVFELARVVLDMALDPDAPAVFDTAGEEAVEMADLARALGRDLDLRLDIQRPPMTAGEDRYVGDGQIYQAAIARSGAVPLGLTPIIRDTAAYIRGLGSPR
jgi:nucleoside-diphosphate-sugar epimerase